MHKTARTVPKFIIMLLALGIIEGGDAVAQQGPWRSPLKIARSVDGVQFDTPTIFQDSSGVPSISRRPGTDTLYCAFQWFRAPKDGPTWDKVAVRISPDLGATWSEPQPIQIENFPAGWQRPFDPAIVVVGNSVRIYFSSSKTKPAGGLDSVVDTYSAIGVGGINYTFESGERFGNPTRPVIDPTVFRYKNLWHYIAPIGAPQEGAYYATSADGLNFDRRKNIASDNTHNWTGNMCNDNSGRLRFYGSGPWLWYANQITDSTWSAYTNTNLHGGDPSVIHIPEKNQYVIIYVGEPYVTGFEDDHSEIQNSSHALSIYPQPASTFCIVKNLPPDEYQVVATDLLGNQFHVPFSNSVVNTSALNPGCYYLHFRGLSVSVGSFTMVE
ncbi:MAG: exo-alpha-sialidase [Ignavibacteria bacterium]|nr:exo-alpha-sialidase [Ignavibacteria bacterium]